MAKGFMEITSAQTWHNKNFEYLMLSGNFWDSFDLKGYIHSFEVRCQIDRFILVRSSFTFPIGNLAQGMKIVILLKFLAF